VTSHTKPSDTKAPDVIYLEDAETLSGINDIRHFDTDIEYIRASLIGPNPLERLKAMQDVVKAARRIDYIRSATGWTTPNERQLAWEALDVALSNLHELDALSKSEDA